MREPSAVESRPYARPQVILHWLIALLVLVQWLSADAMEEFFDEFEDFGPPGFPDGAAVVHAAVGAAILALMVIRLLARFRYGAPPLPRDVPWFISLGARLDHFALYALLFLLPLTGLAALFVSTEAGDIHKALKTLLLVLIALHVAAAAFHTFIRRDGLIWRMLSLRGR